MSSKLPVLSKFGNLSVGGRGAETDTGAEAGSGSGEGNDVFKSMDAECAVCMQRHVGIFVCVQCATVPLSVCLCVCFCLSLCLSVWVCVCLVLSVCFCVAVV
jgi:hypothetical protein